MFFPLPTFEAFAVGNVSSVGSYSGGFADLPPGRIVSISCLSWVIPQALSPFLWGEQMKACACFQAHCMRDMHFISGLWSIPPGGQSLLCVGLTSCCSTVPLREE